VRSPGPSLSRRLVRHPARNNLKPEPEGKQNHGAGYDGLVIPCREQQDNDNNHHDQADGDHEIHFPLAANRSRRATVSSAEWPVMRKSFRRAFAPDNIATQA